jgi:transcription antitermination factor NusG
MKFKYGDNVRIKSGFFAGLTGKLFDGHTTDQQPQYYVDINGCNTTPYEEESNLEPIDYAIDYEAEQKLLDNA